MISIASMSFGLVSPSPALIISLRLGRTSVYFIRASYSSIVMRIEISSALGPMHSSVAVALEFIVRLFFSVLAAFIIFVWDFALYSSSRVIFAFLMACLSIKSAMARSTSMLPTFCEHLKDTV